MASLRQLFFPRRNIRKAQETWRRMSPRARALAQPEGRTRAKPGTTGRGHYYRVVVRPKSEFTMFRIQDVGRKGHSQRLAGKRRSGSWDTQAWLISKEDAHVENGKLKGDSPSTRKILDNLSSTPTHVKGDVFRAKDKRNVPEREKPTPAQKRARSRNIQKAQRVKRVK
ncbi:hypothetical protein KW805_00320 [Candidatus Pacearchaeota archaeon]|nr:hypothetical protein [Candidatus Pacearchaeota archaeon]